MVGIAVVTRSALLIARRASTWTVDEHMRGRSPECVAVDLRRPTQVYCGTARAGVFRSRDSGRNWEPVGPGIDHPMVTAVDVGHMEQADGFGVVSLVATAGWTSPACARSLQLTPGVFPHGPTRIMFSGSKPMRASRTAFSSRSRLARSCARSTVDGPGVTAFAAVRTTRTRR